jgi:hypothetical protein
MLHVMLRNTESLLLLQAERTKVKGTGFEREFVLKIDVLAESAASMINPDAGDNLNLLVYGETH